MGARTRPARQARPEVSEYARDLGILRAVLRSGEAQQVPSTSISDKLSNLSFVHTQLFPAVAIF
jgi:hypothetical protein